MDIDVFSPEGKTLSAAEGESGELVCKKPFPNMPVMFWKDPGRKRYRKSYFEMFPRETLPPAESISVRQANTEADVWTHGDLIRIDPETRGIYVLGRRSVYSLRFLRRGTDLTMSSDGVLNPSGVRFGSSEIYNILATPQFSSSVLDALVVGQQRTTSPYSDPTEQVLLFIKCSPTAASGRFNPFRELDTAIRQQIAQDLSRRHVPSHIFEIDEVPYNANGKKMEIQVKGVVNGGAKALAKMKLSPDELEMLRRFERFYHLESLTQKSVKGQAKL